MSPSRRRAGELGKPAAYPSRWPGAGAGSSAGCRGGLRSATLPADQRMSRSMDPRRSRHPSAGPTLCHPGRGTGGSSTSLSDDAPPLPTLPPPEVRAESRATLGGVELHLGRGCLGGLGSSRAFRTRLTSDRDSGWWLHRSGVLGDLRARQCLRKGSIQRALAFGYRSLA